MLKNRLLPLALFTIFVLAWINAAWAGEHLFFMGISLFLVLCAGTYLFIVAVLRLAAQRTLRMAMVTSMTCACACAGVLMGQPWLGLILGFMVSVLLSCLVLRMVTREGDHELPIRMLSIEHGSSKNVRA